MGRGADGKDETGKKKGSKCSAAEKVPRAKYGVYVPLEETQARMYELLEKRQRSRERSEVLLQKAPRSRHT